jgi:hypothetical protein
VAAFDGLNKFKMVAVAMVTKVQNFLNSLQTSQSFAVIHPTSLCWYLDFHGNAILNFINTTKASTHYGGYSYDVS